MTAATEVVGETSTSASNTFYYLLIPALALALVYWKLQRRRFVELAEKLPGPNGFPVIGNALDFLGNSLRKFNSGYVSIVTLSSTEIKTRSVYIVDSVFHLKRHSYDWYCEYNSMLSYVFVEVPFTKSISKRTIYEAED
jgi:hypothetical protein